MSGEPAGPRHVAFWWRPTYNPVGNFCI